jgi:hypothetical protein
MREVLLQTGGVTIRTAGPEDSTALCELLRRVHIRSSLDLTQERDPDFFRLLHMHQGRHEVLIAEGKDGRATGVGSLSVRPAWAFGERTHAGYLGDLRIVPGSRTAAVMPRAYKVLLERARDRFGAELFYTVIFDDNEAAKKALVERKGKKREDQPLYSVMTPFSMTNVQFTLPKQKPSRPIEHATDRDFDELVDFLARKGKERLMGEVIDAERLRARFHTWPNFGLDSFLLARTDGRISGCLAPFDADPFKRTRVLGYYRQMRWIRIGFDLGSKVMRYPALPRPGETFRFRFLSHLEIDGDDPAILRDLLLQAYREHASDRIHFLSAMIPRGSPLERAFAGFTVNRTPMTVYAVTLPDSRFASRDYVTMKPGFEMALS